jgi:PBP1b-binding outer membrane lipoprotein LpoB
MNKNKMIKNVMLVILFLGALTVFYGYKEFNRKNESLISSTADFKLKSKDIIDSFSSDEKSSNLKFGGKVIQLFGYIKDIVKDDKGFYTIIIGDQSSLSSVRCSIDSSYSTEAEHLKVNTLAVVKGICTGYNADEMGLGSDVILNRCVVVKN